MGDDKIKVLSLKISKPADFMPVGAIPGTSKRLIAVNLIGMGRFV